MTAFFSWLEGLHGGAAQIVGAFAGFCFGILALIVGALFNAQLTRRRDNSIRLAEAKAVATAIYSEIVLLRMRAAYIGRITSRNRIREGFSSVVEFNKFYLENDISTDPIIYKSLLNKLGLLPEELITGIVKFYDDYQSLRIWLPRLVENKERGFDYSVLVVLNPVRSAVLDVNPTLRRLEIYLDLKKPADDPELGDVESVIEMEEIP